MAVERLHFGDPETKYHSYHAAQHVLRYAVARGLVDGKRVLDAACGEGYGSILLKQWGAREVVGVDNNPGAIASAKRHFGRQHISFLVADVEHLDQALPDIDPFDVIVSFETIEHLARPELFLDRLRGLLSPDGVIVISCPNDPAYELSVDANEYHLRQYRFEDFQKLTEAHLGEASQWLLGAPLLGEMNFLPGDRFVEVAHHDQIAITHNKVVENTLSIPCQHNLVTNSATCSGYVGIWGARVSENAVVSTLSVPEYQGIWKSLSFLKSEVARLNELNENVLRPNIEELEAKAGQLDAALLARDENLGEVSAERDSLLARIATDLEPELARQARKADQAIEQINALAQKETVLKERQIELQALLATAEAAHDALAGRIALELGPEIGDLRASNAAIQADCNALAKARDALDARATRLQGAISSLQGEKNELKQERRTLARRVARLEEALRQLKADKDERLEPEIARLRANIEHSKFEKETQALRQRIMYYAENDRRLGGQITELRLQLAEESRLRETWYVPELARLQADFAKLWKTKTEWFDPQLDQRAAHIAQLEADISKLSNEAANVLPVRMIRAAIREVRRITGAVRIRLNQ